MCGIVGYIGHEDAATFLTSALKRLEYRGYDSSGVATINGHGLEVRRATGRITRLEDVLAAQGASGHIGIGHTRWATHGRPTELNAHPHVDCGGHVAVVHNGIIENHHALRRALIAAGHVFRSDTDTEVVAHLIEQEMAHGLPEAVRRAAGQLHGSFAIACMSDETPEQLVAVRRGGAPLVLANGGQRALLASDLPALLGHTREAFVLDDGEMAVLTCAGISLYGLDGSAVSRTPTVLSGDVEAIEKGGYPTFMLKEIFEQPQAVRHALMGRIDAETGEVNLDDAGLTDRELADVSRVSFAACGSSWHAAVAGKYLVEHLAALPAEAELASEFRHRRPIFRSGELVVPISQSGETADTLTALRQARRSVARTLAICNAAGSSISRDASGTLAMRAGIEIGVAATKTFTAQLVAVTLLALKLGVVRGRVDRRAARTIARALAGVPALIEDVLGRSEAIQGAAERWAAHDNALYLGRGLQYPLALEGALKLKEISYVHAEGYAAGEMKHGPIALIDDAMLVVALAPEGPTRTQMLSSIQEVKARDGLVLAVATDGDETLAGLADQVIWVPPAPSIVQHLMLAVPLQLFAYHLAMVRGCNVDQPRNLAKSVTVE